MCLCQLMCKLTLQSLGFWCGTGPSRCWVWVFFFFLDVCSLFSFFFCSVCVICKLMDSSHSGQYSFKLHRMWKCVRAHDGIRVSCLTGGSGCTMAVSCVVFVLAVLPSWFVEHNQIITMTLSVCCQWMCTGIPALAPH